MASLNQFKIVKQKSEKYFNLLQKEMGKEIKLSKESDKARFGFYLYILECFSNIKEIDQLLPMITDTDFNKTLFYINEEDNGIDAVYIDTDNNEINLFNFKYRENFKNEQQQSENDAFTSTKFTSALVNLNSSDLKGKLKSYADEIIKNFKSNEIWKFNLYIVSNESVGLKTKDSSISQLKGLYDLEIKSITLDEIANFMSIRPQPINAKIVLNKDSILSYSENDLTSAKSYIVKISIPELIRISCNEPDLRNKYNIENFSELIDKKLDSGILFDNVRGFLGNTKYNKNIIISLKNEPSKFFMYNNGITMTAENIDVEQINANHKMKLDIKNLQIVNGGQTIRTIHNFNSLNKDNLQKYLSKAEILIRIFKTSHNAKLTNKIAEYTNSQNAISVIDLKSLAYEQLEIEKYLEENNIIYARKIGDTGVSENKDYDYKISLEKFGQILFSINGNPEKASNQKTRIFDKHYKETFGEDNFDLGKSVEIIKEFFNIKKIYQNDFKELVISDQKIFYILYLNRNKENNIKNNINFLERCLQEYKTDDEIASARKLIQKGFKELIDLKIKEKRKNV
jgi:hypothetical protein